MKKFGGYRQLSVTSLTLIAILVGSAWLALSGADDRIGVTEQLDAHAGSYVVVPITAVSDFGITSVAFRLSYSEDWLTPVGVYTTSSTRDFDVQHEIEAPGRLVVELSGDKPLFGSSDVAWVLFDNAGTVGERSPLELYDAVLNGSEETTLEHGWLALGVGETTISLPSDLVGGPGEMVTAPMVVDPADGILGMDLIFEFDSTVLQFVGAHGTPLSTGFSVTANLLTDDRLLVSMFAFNTVSGSGPFLELDFTVVGTAGQSTPLDLVSASINEGAIQATLVDGFFVVCDDSDQDNDGVSQCDGDCDDDDDQSFPGNPEIGCDDRDNDCDPGTPDILDADDDGVACDLDCDDDDDQSFPGNPEVVCDGRDNDCAPPTPDIVDGDEDGFDCDVDCNDDDPDINPGESEVCDGKDNDCDVDVDEDAAGAPLTQSTTCGVGVCSENTGVETCEGGVYGGDTCDPLAGSSPEVCDGDDNDCDNEIDEDAAGAPLTQSTSCGVGDCAGNTGIETCEGGVFGGDTCDPLAGSTPEVCDDRDNDCDNDTDEDAGGAPLTQATSCGVGDCAGNTGVETCAGGVYGGDTCDPLAGSTPEVCDDRDNDCDNDIDEDAGGAPLTQPTSCGVGECAGNTGFETCAGGVYGGDTCDPLAGSTPEVCDDRDNDCDNDTDEDAGGAPLTQPTSCGVGECAGNTGFETCAGGVYGGDTCDPLAGSTPEVCDDRDNDCDNDTDEDAGGAPLTQATTCGVGECAGNTGFETCAGGVYGGDTCDPFAGASPEVCDAADNDCDNIIDNAPVPTEPVGVLGEGAETATFSWNVVSDATGYDVVRGGLNELHATGGDFTVATDSCLADDTASTSVDDLDSPSQDDGFWYIIRAVNCGGDGTYDSGGAQQAGQRDAETDLSPVACP